VVLFPVRVDDAVMETKKAWAGKLRRSRNIGDFRNCCRSTRRRPPPQLHGKMILQW
jgi:hypothetical protein